MCRLATCVDSHFVVVSVVSQASRAELLAELQRLQAVQFGPHWRLVDTAYLGSVLEMLLVRSVQTPSMAVWPRSFPGAWSMCATVPTDMCGWHRAGSCCAIRALTLLCVCLCVLGAAQWSVAGVCRSPWPCRVCWRRCSQKGECLSTAARSCAIVWVRAYWCQGSAMNWSSRHAALMTGGTQPFVAWTGLRRQSISTSSCLLEESGPLQPKMFCVWC